MAQVAPRYNKPILAPRISVITHPALALTFLILPCPTVSTLPVYLEELGHYNVTHVVRCCQPTYNTAQLEEEQNIQIFDMPFKDGGIPSRQLVRAWMDTVHSQHKQCIEITIAVHCVSVLSKAPILVVIA